MLTSIPGYLVADFFKAAQLMRQRPLGPLCYRDALRYLRVRHVRGADLGALGELHNLVLRCTGQAPPWAERIAVWAAAMRPANGLRPQPVRSAANP
jgi:hypothetical protein